MNGGIINQHGTKIYGALTAFFGALQGLITTGAFRDLMSPAGVGWLGILSALATAVLGGMTMARGFNNTTAEKVASAMETAIKTAPPQAGFARASMLLALVAGAVVSLGLLTACATTPQDVVQIACDRAQPTYALERCAKGIAETWEVYQKRAEEIVIDPSTPLDVRRSIQRAEAVMRPAVVELLKATAAYTRIKQELAAGATEEEKLVIANASLERWVQQTLPLIASMKTALGI
jgi:hypothetical protein